jgi:phosphohistidine swiveling domain-containing protein
VTGGIPTADEGVTTCAAVVAFLKCNVPAAIALKGALESAILLAQPVENPEGKAH